LSAIYRASPVAMLEFISAAHRPLSARAASIGFWPVSAVRVTYEAWGAAGAEATASASIRGNYLSRITQSHWESESEAGHQPAPLSPACRVPAVAVPGGRRREFVAIAAAPGWQTRVTLAQFPLNQAATDSRKVVGE
jgi:hypothetical protein